ncbi:MAG: cation-translocating P-type ATPase C-terminal domain-containing protein [bacterium]|nr:cation-translocating P-type ATPase C-terminal domain-containing protein [bacterium]
MLWINIVTDGLPALALGVDSVDPSTMERPPRKQDEPVINKYIGNLIIIQGLIIAVCSLFIFWYSLYIEKVEIIKARTMVFFVLATSQLFHSFNLRSNTRSIFKLKFSTNMKLVYAVLFSFLLQLLVIYFPMTQKIFKTTSITGTDILLAILISSLPLVIMEITKMTGAKKQRGIY